MLSSDEKKELKPKSFRVGTENADKFRNIADKEFTNQDAAFAAMMTAYERENMKTLLPERAKDIEAYQQLITAVSNQFMRMVEESSTADARAREEMASIINSKDELILKFQEEEKKLKEKVIIAEQIKENSYREADRIKKEVAALSEKADSLEITLKETKQKNQETLNDKAKIIEMFSEEILELKNQIKQYGQIKSAMSALEASLKKANEEIALEKEAVRKEREKYREEEFSKKEALLEQREEYENKLTLLRKENDQYIYSIRKEYEEQLKEYQLQFKEFLKSENKKKINEEREDVEE